MTNSIFKFRPVTLQSPCSSHCEKILQSSSHFNAFPRGGKWIDFIAHCLPQSFSYPRSIFQFLNHLFLYWSFSFIPFTFHISNGSLVSFLGHEMWKDWSLRSVNIFMQHSKAILIWKKVEGKVCELYYLWIPSLSSFLW